MKLLNLGCGNTYHKKWTNIDFISNSEYVQTHNLLKGIPFSENSFDVVYHSHVLEHFSKNDGINFIQECFRVLDINGVLRIAVPNLEEIAKEYLENLNLAMSGNIQAKSNYEWIKLELLDQMVRNESGGEMKSYLNKQVIPNESYVYNRIGQEGKKIREVFLNSKAKSLNIEKKDKRQDNFLKIVFKKFKKNILSFKKREKVISSEDLNSLKIGKFRLGGEIHQWMYDRYSLTKLLNEIGFEDIKVCSAFESSVLNWNSYNLDVVNGEIRKPDSLFIEAIKR